jgi:hypothetical protein
MVASGMASFKQFLASWPNRAPGWCTIFFLSFCTMLCLVDLFCNWKKGSAVLIEKITPVGEAQWVWLLFVASVTIPFAAGFVLVEIFRENKEGTSREKSQLETVLEGITFLLLVLAWIPSVIVATAPGGVASLVGNTYFFIWSTAVFVMETAVWWVHDWRKRIHHRLQVQLDEYHKIQKGVLASSREVARASVGTSGSETTTNAEWSEEFEQVGRESDEASVHSEYIPDAVRS